MEDSIRRMAQETDTILDHGLRSLWLYGSVVLGDYRHGWSDIDFIAFARNPISEEQAQKLLTLRHDLAARFPGDPYYRCFEGVIINWQEFQANEYTRLIYWGTTGQRVTHRFELDPFSRLELVRYGRLVWGERDDPFTEPTRAELTEAVRGHHEAIRRYAVETDERLYSCGWLLDIARCLYTLRCGGVIGKTQAGQWALAEHLFPDGGPLRKTLAIRQDPLTYKDQPEIQAWLCSLGPTVQGYADVLDKELESYR